MKLETTAFDIASRFLGIREIKGAIDHPMILAMLQLDQSWPQNDEIPWCSAFVNYICWLLDLPRSRSLAARSWLLVGKDVKRKMDAAKGFDIVILKRPGPGQPDASVIDAPGHVGFFAGFYAGKVQVLGGNQADQVSVAPYGLDQIIGIRRIWK